MIPSHHLLFTGLREEALACLPVLDTARRLELSHDRISLVGPSARVDIAVLHACEEPGEVPWLLLSLRFQGIDAADRDAIAAALRRSRRPGSAGPATLH